MKRKILLIGIQKAGNFEKAFTLFNYFNIKNNGATKTLTWEELMEIQKRRTYDVLENIDDGYPLIYQSHRSWEGYGIHDFKPGFQKLFETFDAVLYCYRNPFDTIISYYHWTMDRDKPFEDVFNEIEVEKLRDLTNFTIWFLPKWIHHVKSTKPHADLVLDYDVMSDRDVSSIRYYKAIQLIDGKVEPTILEQAIDMSSFENIKQMGIDTGRPYGFTPLYKNNFCRDGRSGQYLEVMNQSLIDYIKVQCQRYGLYV